jgi:N-methylhydantoinase B/oxoprolinase/acetone carboxylase alpha subunit
MRSAFEYTCERMSTVLQRASFSPIIYDMVDYSNAIFDPETQLLGQTANCPVHLAAMHFSARASIAKYGADLGPGDVVVLNDPYEGGTHTPDVTLTSPI